MDDGTTQLDDELRTSEAKTANERTAFSEASMTPQIDSATIERRERVVDAFELVSVIGDPRASVGKALDILWASGIRTIGDIRGKKLSDLFDRDTLTTAQQKHFAKTLHKFGVFLD